MYVIFLSIFPKRYIKYSKVEYKWRLFTVKRKYYLFISPTTKNRKNEWWRLTWLTVLFLLKIERQKFFYKFQATVWKPQATWAKGRFQIDRVINPRIGFYILSQVLAGNHAKRKIHKNATTSKNATHSITYAYTVCTELNWRLNCVKTYERPLRTHFQWSVTLVSMRSLLWCRVSLQFVKYSLHEMQHAHGKVIHLLWIILYVVCGSFVVIFEFANPRPINWLGI